MGLPEIIVRNKMITMRPMMSIPLILVDNMETDTGDLEIIGAGDVASVEVYRGADASIFGMKGDGGVLIITTKKGVDLSSSKKIFNVKTTTPLGFQLKKEFYSPAYETPEQINNVSPDLRTTIYWAPDIRTNGEGEAKIQFYTADSPGTYSVVVEGLTPEGLPIYGTEIMTIHP
ncbi:MAG: hypothetical protein LUG96_11220 [Tannerellaceae bacterium]|nr:hypothetical protein [Tannerellaceae bacterium]